MKKIIAEIQVLEIKTRKKTSSEEWLKYYTPKFQRMIKEEALPKIEQGLKDKFINSRDLRRIDTLIEKADLLGVVKKFWKKQKADWSDYSLSDSKLPPEGTIERAFSRSCLGEIRSPSSLDSEDTHGERLIDKLKQWSSGNIVEDWETEGCKEALKELGGKMPKSIKNTLDLIEKMIADFSPLLRQLNELDGYAMTKAEQKKYVPPKSSNEGVKKVKKVLEDLMDRSKKAFQDYLFDNYWSSIEKFLKSRKPTDTKYGANASDWARKYTQVVGGEREPRLSYKEHQERVKVERAKAIGRYVSHGSVSDEKESWDSPKEYELVPDAKRLLKEEVDEQVAGIQRQFVSKNLSKMTSIIESKGDFKEAKEGKITFHRGLFEGDMAVFFEDGSKFSVVNQIVFTISVLGNPFYRFPTTFHDIEWQGEKFKMKPEKWMNESFANVPKKASLLAEIQSLENAFRRATYSLDS